MSEKMSEKNALNRRRFIGATGAATALATLPNLFPPSVLGANERVLMGIIGPGGRGRGVMQECKGFGAQFIAVCDAYKPNVERGLELAEPNAKSFGDFRKLLEMKEIDAVVIATPEHQHAVNLIATVQAGKDSYCEKPMSHSIEEGAEMVKAVRNTDRIVQIGMQRRSSPAVHEAKKIMEEGRCGNVHMVKAYWNWNTANPLNNSPLDGELDWEAFCYPAPVSEFQPMKYRYWRVFWDFSGGHCTDQGTHLMDVVQWFMDSGTPRSAECFGRTFKQEGAETPDNFMAIFDYGNFIASWTLSYTNKFRNGWTIEFQGDGGTLQIDDRGSRYWADSDSRNRGRNYADKPDWEFQGPLPTVPHVENFLECVKSRKEPNAPVEVGHRAVCGPHLANVAYKNKTRAFLNEDATQVKTG